MPLLGNGEYKEPCDIEKSLEQNGHVRRATLPGRRQSQHSGIAKTAIMGQFAIPNSDGARTPEEERSTKVEASIGMKPASNTLSAPQHDGTKHSRAIGVALSDTPATTAPNSPIM